MMILLIGYGVLWLMVILMYFKIADRYNIIDKPNARSSHSSIVIRGGGIIFPLAFLIPFFFFGYHGQWFVALGLIGISLISLLDDMISLSNKVRLLIQSCAVGMLFLAIPYPLNLLFGGLLFVLFIGAINAYNFMDGINGITALYSIVTIGTLFWISRSIVSILPDPFFVSLLAALFVFSFFNLRRRARCFAGDVGSVSIAFIICFLLFNLYIKTGFVSWLLLLGVYGIDTIVTIICRMIRKESIFKAHRSHFYQFLANELGMSHVVVSILYAAVQLILNVVVMLSYQKGRSLPAWGSLFVVLLIYTIFRLRFEGRHRLFTAYNR